jgi:hypothetical protein
MAMFPMIRKQSPTSKDYHELTLTPAHTDWFRNSKPAELGSWS